MRLGSLVLLLVAFAACRVDPGANPAYGCKQDSDCEDGRRCDRGFCVVREGAPCAHEGAVESCYDGPPNTEGVGRCHGGQHECRNGSYGECLGEVVPDTDERA